MVRRTIALGCKALQPRRPDSSVKLGEQAHIYSTGSNPRNDNECKIGQSRSRTVARASDSKACRSCDGDGMSTRGGGRRVCHGAPATSAPVDHASRASWGRTARPPTVPVVEPRGVRNPRVGRDSTQGVDELAVPLERRVRSRAFTAERIAPRQVPRPRPRPSRRRASRLGARRRSALVVARRGSSEPAGCGVKDPAWHPRGEDGRAKPAALAFL